MKQQKTENRNRNRNRKPKTEILFYFRRNFLKQKGHLQLLSLSFNLT